MCVMRQCVNQLRCSLHIDFTIITPHVQVAAGVLSRCPDTCSQIWRWKERINYSGPSMECSKLKSPASSHLMIAACHQMSPHIRSQYKTNIQIVIPWYCRGCVLFPDLISPSTVMFCVPLFPSQRLAGHWLTGSLAASAPIKAMNNKSIMVWIEVNNIILRQLRGQYINNSHEAPVWMR